MSINALYPANGDNAITHAIFVVEWLEPLDEDDFRKAKELQPRLKHELPIMQESQSMSVTFNPQGPINQQTPSTQLDGIHFIKSDLVRGGRAIRALEINRRNIVIMVSDYDRWDSVWKSVSHWFKLAYEVIGTKRQIQELTLQYMNSFQWRGNDFPDMNKIFLQNSPYLPSYIYSTTSLWHTHNGYIEKIKTPLSSNLINNINIDLSNHRGSLVFNINSSHKIALINPEIKTNNFLEKQTLFFNLLHEKNKNHLSKILSSAICKKIGLG